MTFSRNTFKPKIEKFFEFDLKCLDEHKNVLDMETISKNGRFYISPQGKAYPSMTTVLGATADKEYLNEWRERIGEKAAGRLSYHASSRGSDMHNICEAYVSGNGMYLDNVTPVGRKLFHQLKPFLDDNLEKVYGIEQALYSDKHKTAGRTDLLGIYRGKRSVVDYKSSDKPKAKDWIQEYFIQGAGYGTLFNWMTGIDIEQVVILIGVENSTRGQEYVVPFSEYKDEFECRVEKYYNPLMGC